MKKYLSFLLALCMMLSLCACGETTTEETTTSEPDTQSVEESDTITIVDHSGNTVTLPRDIQRIAVCDILPLPSVLAVFFDSAERLVGIAPNSMSAAKNSLLGTLYPEILNAETGFIEGTTVNVEELAKLEPDVVFYHSDHAQVGDTLRNAGFRAVAVSVSSWDYDAVETLNQWIDLLSQMFPENDKSQLCRTYSEKMYQLVQERVADLTDEERVRGFFLFQCNDSSIVSTGERSFGQWWMESVGAYNVAEELEGDSSTPVNLEQIYTWNPDTMFITNFTTYQPDDLYTGATAYDWSGIAAVQEQRVYKMPLGMYRSFTPGIDTPVTLLWLAKTTYPHLFEDMDVTTTCMEYYKEVFGIDLTEEQVNSIFAPAAAAGQVQR